MTTRRTFIALIIAAFLAPAFSFGATKEELQKRFKERYPELRQLKDAGTIGETEAGFVEVVAGGNAEAQKLVSAENADRKELYALIAKSEGVSADDVAKQNAQRNFDRARPGDMLKVGGSWKKKS